MIYNHDPVIADLHRYEAEQDRAIAREERLEEEAKRQATLLCRHSPDDVVFEAFDDEDCSEKLDQALAELARTVGDPTKVAARAAICERLTDVLWRAALIAGRREAEREEDDDR